MSDRIMLLDEALEWVAQDKSTRSTARAARTIAKAGEVLGRLDREYATVADSNPRPGRDEYAAGYLAGIDTAHTWLQKALEDHHD